MTRRVKVLLIEAGPHANRFWVITPAGMAKLCFNDKLNWNCHAEPMAQLQNRQMFWPRGKTSGGSSSIYGMVFVRGHDGVGLMRRSIKGGAIRPLRLL